MTLSLECLLQYVAGYSSSPPRTAKLEQDLQIGAGFHNKWYRSQKDHWLGWLEVQQRQAQLADSDRDAAARGVWQRLNCSPMMFWLAEAAGVQSEYLDRAASAARAATLLNPKDGAPHGKMMRTALRWELIEQAVLARLPEVDRGVSEGAALEAFGRLVAKNSQYRRLIAPSERE